MWIILIPIVSYFLSKQIIPQFIKNYQLSDDNYMSRRLYNIFISLINEPHLSIRNSKNFIDKYKYIEDIDKKLFLRIRNAGRKSWIEFNEVTKNYR